MWAEGGIKSLDGLIATAVGGLRELIKMDQDKGVTHA